MNTLLKLIRTGPEMDFRLLKCGRFCVSSDPSKSRKYILNASVVEEMAKGNTKLCG